MREVRCHIYAVHTAHFSHIASDEQPFFSVVSVMTLYVLVTNVLAETIQPEEMGVGVRAARLPRTLR